MKFTKMHGCGNDYIYINCFEEEILSPNELSDRLSDRHKGIGGDGICLICPSEVADAKMRLFNADGSEANMCGNGIRCVAKYLRDNGIVNENIMRIETLSGIKEIMLSENGITVDMGIAVIEDQRDNMTFVSMGNPHCVIFRDNLDTIEKLFDDINIEFVKVIDSNTLQMRVWERGSGETLACGTGACASVVAAVNKGYCKRNETVKVILLGGELFITYRDDGCVIMTGNAEKVFEGEISI
jgi:diaminopimelate epimerase